jgi:predicted lipoprotein with Yx(FWY)xxD motif
MRRALVAVALALGCRSEPATVDTSQRSMSVPIPATGTPARPAAAERDIFTFPKRAKQDPTKLGLRSRSGLGEYVVDGAGRALYSYSGDDAGQSACLTNCASVWPPALVDGIPREVAATIDASRLTLTTRPDGTRQLVFAGMPLYYSESDLKPDDAWGHFAMSFGGRFTLVSPTGKPLPPPR